MKRILSFCTVIILIAACSSSKTIKQYVPERYVPDDKALYATILHMDSVYFTAYNTCDLTTQADLYADSIEFYHDKGGLSTSKSDLLESLKKYICGKVTRQLVQGSVEVYPIKDYGAIEIGWHTFHNNQEPNAISHPGRFVIVWQHRNNKWKMTRVISLH
jgi:hypothetical protein